MPITFDTTEPAIVRGIKTVGIGKKGSRPLSTELAQEICKDLEADKVSSVALGAFLGALVVKGVTPAEKILEQALGPGALSDPQRIVALLAPQVEEAICRSCVRLLKGEELSRNEAYELGKFLISDKEGDGARGLAVSILRVRYETADEYEGLWQSLQESLAPVFRTPVPAGEPIIQLAEPFDGVDQSYLLTPLIAEYLQSLGYRVISLVGRNSGPKKGINLLDVIQALKIPCAGANSELGEPKPRFGWYFHQQNLSPRIDRWVELRHQTVKRPFFSTLEKFLNPAQARIIITSAFHPPYSEKMTAVAERAGFPASVVIRNGLEGTLASPLRRPVKILCSARQGDGQYRREELTFDPVSCLGFEVEAEEKVENVSAQKNAELIRGFTEEGHTTDALFHRRVKVSCSGLKTALDWIEKNLQIQ